MIRNRKSGFKEIWGHLKEEEVGKFKILPVSLKLSLFFFFFSPKDFFIRKRKFFRTCMLPLK